MLHILNDALRHLPSQQMMTLVHWDGFAGIGIPALAVRTALARLWNEGVYYSHTTSYMYENDKDSIKMYSAITKDHGNRIWAGNDVRNSCQHMQNVCQHYGNSFIVSLAEMVPCADPRWTTTLTTALGSRHRVTTANNEDAATRDRDYYINPRNLLSIATKSHKPTHTNEQSFWDNSVWPAHRQFRTTPTLRAIYPNLVNRQATLSQSDKTVIKSFQIRDARGHIKQAGPLHLAQWLGLRQKHAQAITQQYPCDDFDKCGTLNFCQNCSTVCAALGRAWNLDCATNTLQELLRQAHAIAVTQRRDRVLLFTAGSPCTKISKGILSNRHLKNPNMKVGPHADPSNLIWPWLSTMIICNNMQDNGRSCEFGPPHECSSRCSMSHTLSEVQG